MDQLVQDLQFLLLLATFSLQLKTITVVFPPLMHPTFTSVLAKITSGMMKGKSAITLALTLAADGEDA